MAATTTTSTRPMLASINAESHTHLVIGISALTATRCAQSLGSGAHPILIAAAPADKLPQGLEDKMASGLVGWRKEEFDERQLLTLGRAEVSGVVDAVFVTLPGRDAGLAEHISALCRRHRVPVNVVDAPHLCTFSLLSVHADGPLQIGVTTNGRGCRLASRIRREVAGLLPRGLGDACERLGALRSRVAAADAAAVAAPGDLEDALGQASSFNRLVVAADDDDDDDETDEELRARRARWLAQVCEYWPLKRLAGITDDDVDRLLTAYPGPDARATTTTTTTTTPPARRLGRIILAGAGPGHPDLLTTATLRAIQTADLILADKLVPSAVLDLIPRRTPVRIARKFPGNADRAQDELLSAALEGVAAGATVLRLKQGDPYLYGRGGEEVSFFRDRGMASRVSVLPGLTSALTAGLFAGIPATQRDVADQVLICTGTGKKGAPPAPPSYLPSRTVVFLMALHRIADLVLELTTADLDPDPAHPAPSSPRRIPFPASTPCAVIERASCPDQRVIRTTLQHVAHAIETEGSRPPGLLIVGHACHVLSPQDPHRPYLVEDGFRGLDPDPESEPAWPAALHLAMNDDAP